LIAEVVSGFRPDRLRGVHAHRRKFAPSLFSFTSIHHLCPEGSTVLAAQALLTLVDILLFDAPLPARRTKSSPLIPPLLHGFDLVWSLHPSRAPNGMYILISRVINILECIILFLFPFFAPRGAVLGDNSCSPLTGTVLLCGIVLARRKLTV